jgi:hypothetical protein
MMPQLTEEQTTARTRIGEVSTRSFTYYALIADSRAYIGVTGRGVQRRFGEHLRAGETGSTWLTPLIAEARLPQCLRLETTTRAPRILAASRADTIELVWMVIAHRNGLTIINSDTTPALATILSAPRPYLLELVQHRRWPYVAADIVLPPPRFASYSTNNPSYQPRTVRQSTPPPCVRETLPAFTELAAKMIELRATIQRHRAACRAKDIP